MRGEGNKCHCQLYHTHLCFTSYYVRIIFCFLLLRCQAQSDFYDLSNSNYWGGTGTSSVSEIGNGYGRIGAQNPNPFTPQDFGGSSSDGFDHYQREEEYQKQLRFQVNGIPNNLRASPHLRISSLPDFHAYGSSNNGNTFSGDADLAVDDGQPDETEGGAITRFPTLIPPQKLAQAVGFTEPAIDVEEVTESTQPNWELENHGGENVKQAQEIRDVSMMKSIPVSMGRFNTPYASQQQQQMFGNVNSMPNGNGNNNCFGSSYACSPGDGSNGDSFLGGDGTYQFPMPDGGAVSGLDGVGGMASGGFFSGQQMATGSGTGGSIFSFGNPTIGANGQQQFLPQQNAFMGMGAFGAKNTGLNEGGDDDDEEEEMDGAGVGEFVENGLVNVMNNGMGQTGAEFGQQKSNGLQQYAEYLEMIKRKYGIGLPGINSNAPNVAANAFGLSQMINQNQQQQQLVGQQQQFGGNIGFGQQMQQWNSLQSNDGKQRGTIDFNKNGIGTEQMQSVGGIVASAITLPKHQLQNLCHQQFIKNEHHNSHQDGKMLLECSTLFHNNNNNNNYIGGANHNKEITNSMHIHGSEHHLNLQNHQSQHQQHGTIAGFIRSNGNNNDIESYQQKHGNGENADLNAVNNAVGAGGIHQNKNGHYGSATLGGAGVDNIDSDLGNNNNNNFLTMYGTKNSGLISSSSANIDGTSGQYTLNGANIPYPFGTAQQPTTGKMVVGKGVGGGEWLPPAPSVDSLLGQKPILNNGGKLLELVPNGGSGQLYSSSSVPPEHHQQQQQRSIDAATALLQQQLLLALLSTTSTTVTPTTPVPTTTSTTTDSITTMIAQTTTPQQAQLPIQQSTTSVQALTQQIRRLPAVLYTDSRDLSSRKLEAMLREIYALPLVTFYVDRMDGGTAGVEKNLEQLTAHSGLPYLFICGTFIGSNEHIQNYHQQRQMPRLVEYVCNGDSPSSTTTSSFSNKTHSKKKRRNNASSLGVTNRRQRHHLHLMMMDEGKVAKTQKNADDKSRSQEWREGNNDVKQLHKRVNGTNDGSSRKKSGKAGIANSTSIKQQSNKTSTTATMPPSIKLLRDVPAHSSHHISTSSAKRKPSMLENNRGIQNGRNQEARNENLQKHRQYHHQRNPVMEKITSNAADATKEATKRSRKVMQTRKG